MIKLVAVLCSLSAPFACHDETVSTGSSMVACTIAMRDLPEWSKQFPAYELRGWKCQMGSKATEREA